MKLTAKRIDKSAKFILFLKFLGLFLKLQLSETN